MNFKTLDRKGWQFCILVILLSILPYYLVLTDINEDSPWTLLLMWIPAIAAIILKLYNKMGLFSGLQWNPLKDIKWVLLAVFIPFLIELATVSLVVALEAAKLHPDFFEYNEGLISLKGVSMLFGAHPQPWYVLIPNYLISYLVGALLYSLVFALGEEYGWRGYLQRFWADKNHLMGFVAIGIFWGLWHFPAVLFGHNYPSYPVLGAFVLMPLLCTIFSVAFGVALNRKLVIWVPVVFHGALNISTDVSNTALLDTSINEPIKDAIWTMLWFIAAYIVYKTNKSKLFIRYESK